MFVRLVRNCGGLLNSSFRVFLQYFRSTPGSGGTEALKQMGRILEKIQRSEENSNDSGGVWENLEYLE